MGMTILEELQKWPFLPKDALQLFPGKYDLRHIFDVAVPVDCANISQLAFIENDQRWIKDNLEWDKIPNFAPPWDTAWYEFTVPFEWPIPKGSSLRLIRVGILVLGFQLDDGWGLLGIGYERGGRETTALGVVGMELDINGGIKRSNQGVITLNYDDSIIDDNTVKAVSNLLRIVGLANSFAHCKNVEIIDNPPLPKPSAAQQKRHGIPKLTYKTLNIQPMQKVLNDEGGMGSGNSLPKALHICRGHFKDYRERGLFGRNKGLYWWDMTVRGKKEHGMVVKDYAVQAPEGLAQVG